MKDEKWAVLYRVDFLFFFLGAPPLKKGKVKKEILGESGKLYAVEVTCDGRTEIWKKNHCEFFSSEEEAQKILDDYYNDKSNFALEG